MTDPLSTSVSGFVFPFNGLSVLFSSGFFPQEDQEGAAGGDPIPPRDPKTLQLADIFANPSELVKPNWQHAKMCAGFRGFINPFDFECGEKNELGYPLIDATDQLILKLAYYLAELVSNNYIPQVTSESWRKIKETQEERDRYPYLFHPICLMARKVHETLLEDWDQLSLQLEQTLSSLEGKIAQNTVPSFNTDPTTLRNMEIRYVLQNSLQEEVLSRSKAQENLLRYFSHAIKHHQENSLAALREGLMKDFFPDSTSPELWFRPFGCLTEESGFAVVPFLLSRQPKDPTLIPFGEIIPDRSSFHKKDWDKTEVSASFHGWYADLCFADDSVIDGFALPLFTDYENTLFLMQTHLREVVFNRWLAKVLLQADKQMHPDTGEQGQRNPTYRCNLPMRLLFLLARKSHQRCVKNYPSLKRDVERLLAPPEPNEDRPTLLRLHNLAIAMTRLLEEIEKQHNLETYALSVLSHQLTGEPLDEGLLLWMGSVSVGTVDSYIHTFDILPVGAKFWDSCEWYLLKQGYQAKGTSTILPYQ